MDEDYRRWTSYLQEISDAVSQVPGVRTTMHKPEGASPFPTMIIEWDPSQVGITAGDVYRQLLDGEPRIMSHATGDGYSFNVRPPSIRPGDQTLAGRRIAEVLRSAPKGIQKKTLAPAGGDIAGRWDVDVQYTRGTARHKLFLITSGNRVEGSHIGRRLQGNLTGTIDGDRVRLRSSLPTEGTQLTYRFDGRLQGPSTPGPAASLGTGQTMEGEVSLGEYGKARWTARRS